MIRRTLVIQDRMVAGEERPNMFRPDRVVLREGRPVAVIEAKARPVQPAFHEPVVRQLQEFSTSVSSPWVLLIDPEKTEVFRSDVTQPVVTLSTREILEGETRFRPSVIGEETLLFVLDKWLQELPEEANAFVDRHPELKDFARDLSNHITIVREWSPGRSGGG
jgi:hypothetical protein